MPIEREYMKIEKETGAILEEGLDKIYTSEEISQIEARKRLGKQKTEFDEYIESLGQYSFLFYNYLKKIDIPNEIKTRFIFLTAYIKYNSHGLLVDTDEKNQTPLDRNTLMIKLNIKEKAFIRTMTTLKESKLVVEKNKCYYVNEKLVIRGKLTKQKMNQSFTRIFSNTIKELYYNCSIREQSQLYYFYAILPLVNFKYNCVCHNPNETDLHHIQKMSVQDICISVGYERTQWKRFWNALRGFKINNEYAIATTIIGDGFDNFLIKVNPKLYYAGNSNCFKELQQCCYEFFIGDSIKATK